MRLTRASYAGRLRSLDGATSEAPARRRVLLLTGQSDAAGSGLSPDQVGLLRPLADQGWSVPASGFPWHPSLDRPHRHVPLPLASVRNTAQYLWARHDPDFGRVVARRIDAVRRTTSEELLVVTGSCGLQLWLAALPHLAGDLDRPVPRVLALGPVAEPAPASVHVVQGRRDRISRLGYAGVVHERPDVGHLGYAASPEVRAILATWATGGQP